MKYPVLILDADYKPLKIKGWQETFRKLFGEESPFYIVATYSRVIRDGRGRPYNIPAVIVHKNQVGAGNKRAAYNNIGILLRDKHTCQYCGRNFPSSRLNVDHIVPRSKPTLLPHGIKMSSWENVVCSCIPCNVKKGNLTLKECGYRLLKQPRALTKAEQLTLKIKARDYPKEWTPYL